MNQGSDELWDGTHQAALRLLIDTFKQNKAFFVPRVPQLYEELRRLVSYCRYHQRNNTRALIKATLQTALLRSFGVQVRVPPHRQLSILAGLIRYLLVEYERMQQQAAMRGGAQLLMDGIRQRLSSATFTTDVDLLVLDAVLERLADRHLASVQLLELRYFARLGIRDIAREMNNTVVATERDLRFAKAWLLAYLQVNSRG